MTGRASCPECGTILRIRDRTFVGRRVNCPECRTPLRIEAFEEEGGFAIRKLQPAELKNAARGHRTSGKTNEPAKRPKVTFGAWLSKVLSSPLTAACLLLTGMIAFLAVLMFNPKLRVFSPRTTPTRVSDSPTDPVHPAPPITDGPVSEKPATAGPTVSPIIDDSESLSALEPANVDGPTPQPPPTFAVEQDTLSIPPEPVPVEIDVASKMSQKLVSFKQPKVSRRNLVEALSEYLGAPIRYDPDELGTAQLEEQVSFELTNTTVGDIIKTVADEAKWEMTVERTGLRLAQKKTLTEP